MPSIPDPGHAIRFTSVGFTRDEACHVEQVRRTLVAEEVATYILAHCVKESTKFYGGFDIAATVYSEAARRQLIEQTVAAAMNPPPLVRQRVCAALKISPHLLNDILVEITKGN